MKGGAWGGDVSALTMPAKHWARRGRLMSPVALAAATAPTTACKRPHGCRAPPGSARDPPDPRPAHSMCGSGAAEAPAVEAAVPHVLALRRHRRPLRSLESARVCVRVCARPFVSLYRCPRISIPLRREFVIDHDAALWFFFAVPGSRRGRRRATRARGGNRLLAQPRTMASRALFVSRRVSL